MKNSGSLTVSLRQQGNSVGVTLPKVYLDALGLAKGSQVDMVLKNGLIEMRPHAEEGINLEHLLSRYNPDLHNYDDLLPGEIGSELFNEDH